MKKYIVLFFLTVFAVGAAIASNLTEADGNAVTWSYKITVEIETPEGIKSGSAVREIKAFIPKIPLPESRGVRYKVAGEAVAVDLGARGVVFALIDWDSYEDVYRAFPWEHGSPQGTLKHFSTLPSGTKAELKEGHPRIVMFEDITNPKSVKLVYAQSWSREEGYKPHSYFAEIYGAGYGLKSIMIEITDLPVTWKIDKWLLWLSKVLMSNIDGTSVTFENKLSNTLHGGNFKTGEKI